jgi:hypothetical protein
MLNGLEFLSFEEVSVGRESLQICNKAISVFVALANNA